MTAIATVIVVLMFLVVFCFCKWQWWWAEWLSMQIERDHWNSEYKTEQMLRFQADEHWGRLSTVLRQRKPYFICAYNRTAASYSAKQHPKPILLTEEEADTVATGLSGNMDLIPEEELLS